MCVEVFSFGFARPVPSHIFDVPTTLPLIRCPVRISMCMLNIRTAVPKNRTAPPPPNVELDFLLTRSQDCCCSRGLMLFTSSFHIATSLGGFLNNAAVHERWRGWGVGRGKGGEIISSARRDVGGGREAARAQRVRWIHDSAWMDGRILGAVTSPEWERASREAGCF